MSSAKPIQARMRAIRQIASFGLVGVAATLLHVAVFSISTEALQIEPQVANVIAFLSSLPVSYAGNMHLTFGRRPKLVRFLVTAFAGYTLNAVNVHAVQTLGLPSLWAVPGMMVIVPALLFLLSRFWVFRSS